MTNTDETSRRFFVPKEEMFAQFNHAITAFRTSAHNFESEIAQPAVGVFFSLFEEHPILATFLAILTVLSFFPILAFVTASGVTLVSFVTFALVTSLSAAFALIIGFLLILISTLVGAGFIAAIITNVCINVYLAFRLFALVRQKGASEGFSCWIGEIWKHSVSLGSITLKAVSSSSHQVHPEVVQPRQPSELSAEDSDSDRKVEGPPS